MLAVYEEKFLRKATQIVMFEVSKCIRKIKLAVGNWARLFKTPIRAYVSLRFHYIARSPIKANQG